MDHRDVVHPIRGHDIHVVEWGNPNRPTVLLYHGFSRTARDFDELAQRLSDDFFVLCPDAPGRGKSSWSDNPARDYRLSNFAKISRELLEIYGISKIGWVGTSMGGVIGIKLDAMPGAPHVGALVLNDVGPGIAQVGKQRISGTSAALPTFDTRRQAREWLLENYSKGGRPTDAFLERTLEAQMRVTSQGKLTLGYDPAINLMLTTRTEELDCWDSWGRTTAPTLVLWGQASDVLTADMVDRMRRSRPEIEIAAYPGLGHAPNLSDPARIELIAEFLRRHL